MPFLELDSVPGVDVMRAIKRALDPQNILNPARSSRSERRALPAGLRHPANCHFIDIVLRLGWKLSRHRSGVDPGPAVRLVGGLLVAVLTAALVAPYFIDWTNTAPISNARRAAILGRSVTVRGEAQARLLPFPFRNLYRCRGGRRTGRGAGHERRSGSRWMRNSRPSCAANCSSSTCGWNGPTHW